MARALALISLVVLCARAHAQDEHDPTEFGLPTAAVEVVARRTANTVHFQLPHGKRIAVASLAPMHYRDGASWKALHARLVSQADGTFLANELPYAVRVRPTDISMGARDESWGIRLKIISATVTADNVITFTLPIAPSQGPPQLVTAMLTLAADGVVLTTSTVNGTLGQGMIPIPYETFGTFGPMSVVNGAIESPNWVIGRPALMGADGVVYDTAEWRMRAAPQRLEIAWTDSSLPVTALPYSIDPSNGPRNPGTATNCDPGSNTEPWSNPSNIASSNDSRATTTTLAVGEESDWIVASNFTFSLGISCGTIDGIAVDVERRSETGTRCEDESAALTLNAGTCPPTSIGEKCGGSCSASGCFCAWSGTDTYVTYGSSSDTWGSTWSIGQVQSANFGFIMRAASTANTTCSIDHVRMTITYTETSCGGLRNAIFLD